MSFTKAGIIEIITQETDLAKRQQAGQLPENLMAMLDSDHVSQVREYGTCGVSRSVASFIHESHRFPYQKEYAQTPLTTALTRLESIED